MERRKEDIEEEYNAHRVNAGERKEVSMTKILPIAIYYACY
jgi:hypothetical protein